MSQIGFGGIVLVSAKIENEQYFYFAVVTELCHIIDKAGERDRVTVVTSNGVLEQFNTSECVSSESLLYSHYELRDFLHRSESFQWAVAYQAALVAPNGPDNG